MILVALGACNGQPVTTLTNTVPVSSITTISGTTTQTNPVTTGTTPATSLDTSPITIPASGVKTAGDLRLWILTTPNPPISGNNTLEAFVVDTNGQPVSDAVLTFDINMTNMNMGRSILRPALVGAGRYSRAVFFSMSGPWRVIISIARAGQTSNVQFDFTVKNR
jgi:hypothetical protein